MKPCHIAVLVCLLLTACGGENAPGSRPGEVMTVAGLVLESARKALLPGAQSFVGTVESSDRARLGARIEGRVEELLAAEGEAVVAGQVLATIVGSLAVPRLAEAEAARAGAAAELAAARARAELAAVTEQRYARLFAGEAVTPQEFDRVRSERTVAEQQVTALQEAATGARAVVAGARLGVEQTRVTAPFAGSIVAWDVKAGSTVMPGTPLLSIDRSGPRLVRVALPESLLGEVGVGSAFVVEIPAVGLHLPGTVKELIATADPGSRSFQVKIELPPEAALSAGLFARVRPAGKGESALLVPRAALVRRGQLDGIYVVEEGLLRYRLVRTGRIDGERVEILSGLREGEVLVVDGVDRAKHGARVED